MEILAEISEQSVGIHSAEEPLGKNFRLRKSARGVIRNERNEVSIQFVSKHNYYKLPGGGVEIGETIEEALKREIIEEVGCDIVIEHALGMTIEYRTQHNLLHISYGFLARVDGDIRETSYEQGEIDDGFKPLWLPMKTALENIDPTRPLDHYEGTFIVQREHLFLTEALRFLEQ